MPTKKNLSKRNKKNKKKKTKKVKKVKKVKDKRKFTDNEYPYRNHTKDKALENFLKFQTSAKSDMSSKSLLGIVTVDYGTERARVKTKYRNKSLFERWNDKVARKKMMTFAKRLKKQDLARTGRNSTVTNVISRAISLSWGTINTMRPAAALNIYKKYKATSVLDFTAGWGSRMVAASALGINYIGIDANKNLSGGYNKIIKLIQPHTNSKIHMTFNKAEKVDFSKLPKYDFVFTSPPYEYLEVYENMENYENTGKIKQPYSAKLIKSREADGFYDSFIIPAIMNAYKYLPMGKYMCLNIPDLMYKKIKKKWKAADKKEKYFITKRIGSNVPQSSRNDSEYIYCWKKK